MPRPSHSMSIVNRRQLFGNGAGALGAAALATLLGRATLRAAPQEGISPRSMPSTQMGLPDLPHFAARAKRVIYLFQSGGPSQIDLFDPKPKLRELHGSELPDSVRQGQRLTEMTHKQASLPCAGSVFDFTRHGESGLEVSEALPHTASMVDQLCLIRSVHTEAINHDPAITFINTGSQQLGKPSLGSWLSYGIGSENEDLPSYVVLLSKGSSSIGQPLFSRLWGSGFLPSRHQGVRLRSGSDPVLYLSNPPGIDRSSRRRILDGLAELNGIKASQSGDPEISTRITQYELAYRMQASVPELMALSAETSDTFERYGPDSRKPGTFAANCLLARRLAERGVRYIQLFHRGWDQHGNLPENIGAQCRDTDQAAAALVKDLKQRGMLDETLVVWGGEFGRTAYCQGKLTKENYGRDHHGRCFSMWVAGGGIRKGCEYGKTDEFGYNVVESPVHIRDINATILHLLGIDHRRLIFPYQGLDQRLTGVEKANVVREILDV